MPTVKVNTWVDEDGTKTDIELAYDIHGPEDGEAVLLICGLGGQLLQWNFNSIVKPLADAGYRVIRVDNRDSGRSTYLPKKAISSVGVRLKMIASGWTDYLASFFANTEATSTDDSPRDTGFPVPITTEHDYDLNGPLVPIPGKAPLPVRQEISAFSQWLGLTPPRPYYELLDMAVDLCSFLRVLDVSRVHLIGVSMGGMIAQLMAALQPSHILSQTLLMTNTYNRAAHLHPSLPFLLKLFISRKAPQGDDIEEWAKFMTEGNAITGMRSPDKTFDGGKAPIEVMREYMRRAINRTGVGRQMHAVDTSPCRDALLQWCLARVPTLIMHGDEDRLVPATNAHHMFELAVQRAKEGRRREAREREGREERGRLGGVGTCGVGADADAGAGVGVVNCDTEEAKEVQTAEAQTESKAEVNVNVEAVKVETEAEVEVEVAVDVGVYQDDVVIEETEEESGRVLRKHVQCCHAPTTMYLLRSFAHDMPDEWCRIMNSRLIAFLRQASQRTSAGSALQQARMESDVCAVTKTEGGDSVEAGGRDDGVPVMYATAQSSEQ